MAIIYAIDAASSDSGKLFHPLGKKGRMNIVGRMKLQIKRSNCPRERIFKVNILLSKHGRMTGSC